MKTININTKNIGDIPAQESIILNGMAGNENCTVTYNGEIIIEGLQLLERTVTVKGEEITVGKLFDTKDGALELCAREIYFPRLSYPDLEVSLLGFGEYRENYNLKDLFGTYFCFDEVSNTYLRKDFIKKETPKQYVKH